MNFHIVTIFPEFFNGPFQYGVVGKAQAASLLTIKVYDLRHWTKDRHRTVDDRPFGGGEGMLLKPQPLFDAVEEIVPVRGPGQANCDFSLFKSYTMHEGIRAQFRFEVFNLTNTPLFNGMNTTFGSATFGQITNQANYPRIVQLGVRVSY